MPLYEHVLLGRQDLSTAQVDALVEEYKSVIETHEGRVSKSEYWGLKPLAYKIKKNRKAHYILMNINSESPAVKEMDSIMGLNEDVLRTLTLRVDELETEPSVIMRSRSTSRSPRRERDEENSNSTESKPDAEEKGEE